MYKVCGNYQQMKVDCPEYMEIRHMLQVTAGTNTSSVHQLQQQQQKHLEPTKMLHATETVTPPPAIARVSPMSTTMISVQVSH